MEQSRSNSIRTLQQRHSVLGKIDTSTVDFVQRIAAITPRPQRPRKLGLSQRLIDGIVNGEVTRVGMHTVRRLAETCGDAYENYVLGKENEAEAALIRQEARALLERLDKLETKRDSMAGKES